MAKKPKGQKVVFKVAKGFKEQFQAARLLNPSILDKLTTFNNYKRESTPKPLPADMKDHKLKGKLKDYRECHLADDILLVYKSKESTITLLCLCDHDSLNGGKAAAMAKRLKGLF